MRPTHLFFALIFCFITVGCSRHDPNLVVFDRDPRDVVELERLLAGAAEKGATRVCFPSGQWNWNCFGCRGNIAKKNNPSDWSSDGHILNKQGLLDWLKANAVVAVEISISKDADIACYFELERILRSHSVLYEISTSDSTDKTVGFKLREYDGPRIMSEELSKRAADLK